MDSWTTFDQENEHQNDSINRSIESNQSLDIGPLPNRQYRPVADLHQIKASKGGTNTRTRTTAASKGPSPEHQSFVQPANKERFDQSIDRIKLRQPKRIILDHSKNHVSWLLSELRLSARDQSQIWPSDNCLPRLRDWLYHHSHQNIQISITQTSNIRNRRHYGSISCTIRAVLHGVEEPTPKGP